MKHKNKLRLLSCFVAVSLMLGMSPAEGLLNNVYDIVDAASVGDKLSVDNDTPERKGISDGYSYDVWIDRTGGNGTMTLGQGATFKAEWDATVPLGYFIASRGLDFGSTKKATDYSYIGLDYEADYRQNDSQQGNSYLGVYGWFQNKGVAENVPLVEYNIIEDWVDWVPDAPGKMVTIDGAQYKIFQIVHTGATINGGSETFRQYFSVRQDKRTSGHITVSDHFKAWAAEGWGIGNLYEVALRAQGWQSSGVVDIKNLNISTIRSCACGTLKDPEKPSTEVTTPSDSSSSMSPDEYSEHATAGDKFSVGNDDFYHKGTSDNYLYEVWMEQRGINGTMTIGQGATFKAEWNAIVPSGNFIARRGLDLGSEKKATDYKYIGIDYEADYRQTGAASTNGNSRLCAYGWSPQEVVKGNVLYYEYYIIEDWVDWCPDAPGKIVMIDGAEYKIFKSVHSYPSINGPTEIFNQYFSVRQDKRTSGHITVSDHFKAWADEGWTIGKLSEVTLNIEGWQSSGIADIKKLDIRYNTVDSTQPSTEVTTSSDTSSSLPPNELTETTLVVTTTPVPVTTTLKTTVEPVEVKGDTDGNGAVTATDAVKLMQAMTGKISLTSEQTSRADIDGDGKISIVDLIRLKNMLI